MFHSYKTQNTQISGLFVFVFSLVFIILYIVYIWFPSIIQYSIIKFSVYLYFCIYVLAC